MSFLYFALVGLISGWLAGKVTKGSGFGLLGNLFFGIIGAMLGGWLFDVIGISSHSTLGSIITATVGAVVLLFILGKVKK